MGKRLGIVLSAAILTFAVIGAILSARKPSSRVTAQFLGLTNWNGRNFILVEVSNATENMCCVRVSSELKASKTNWIREPRITGWLNPHSSSIIPNPVQSPGNGRSTLAFNNEGRWKQRLHRIQNSLWLQEVGSRKIHVDVTEVPRR
jgi:hypothetical protein